MANFCPNCGSPLAAGARFCPNCGKPVPKPDVRSQASPRQTMHTQAGNRYGTYIPDQGWKEMFFRYDNRLNRKRYFLRNLCLGAAAIPAGILGELGDDFILFGIASLILYVCILVSSLMLSIRRCHDFGRSGWFLLLVLIPVVGVFISFYILLKKGDFRENQYGPDPLENA